MPALQVRNCPNGIGEMLKARADANHRTLSQETIAVLEEFFEREHQMAEARTNRAKRTALFERLARSASFELPDAATCARDLIDDGRESGETVQPCLC